MQCFKNFVFLTEATTGVVGNALSNNNAGRTLVIQVTGTNTGLKLDIEGAVDMSGETPVYTALSTKDAKTGTVAAQITADGIYIIDAVGISSIRANTVQVTTGNVSVFGKLMSY